MFPSRFLVRVVERLDFIFALTERVAADFLAQSNLPLSDDLIFLALRLRNLLGDALLNRFLLEILHGIELHLFAHLVEVFDELGIASDPEVFAFVEQELLVDEIAEDILLTIGVGFVGIFAGLRLDFRRGADLCCASNSTT